MKTICVILLAVLLTCATASPVADPVEIIGTIIKGFFREFQKDIADEHGCYYVIGGIYNDTGTVIHEIQDFQENDIPRIIAAITDIVYRCIDIDTPCKVGAIVNATKVVINNPELIKQRVTVFVLLTFLNNLQKGLITADYDAIGKALGYILRNILALQI